MFRFTALLAVLAAAGCGGGGSGGGAAAAPRLAHAAIISGESVRGFKSATFPDGSTLVMGEFDGTMTIGEGEANEITLTSAPDWSLFLAKYGPDDAFEWVRTIEGSHANGVACIVLPDGSSVVTADIVGVVVFGAGEPNETTLDASAGGSCIARYSADGALIWAKYLTANTNGLASLGDAFLICGDFYGTAVFAIGEADETSITSAGKGDHYVALYGASSGKLDWVRRSAGPGNAAASSVAAFPNGDLVVTGYFQEACVFGSGEPNETTLTTTSNGAGFFSINPYVARYDVNGTLAWARKVASSGDEVTAFAAAACPDGSSVISGRLMGVPTVFGPGEPNETTLSGPGLFVARYGPLGDLRWAKSVESSQEFNRQGELAALSDSSVLVTGTFRSEARAGFGEPNETLLVADEGAFLARYRPDGTLAWAGREAQASYSWGRSVSTAADDTFVWLGEFDQTEGLALEDGTVFPPRADQVSVFIARYRE